MEAIIKHVFSKTALFICSFIMLFSTFCFAQNPFITTIYTADPSAHVWADGRLYVYPSHDIDPPLGCDLMDRYHVYSTADMVNWTDEGEILRASQVSWGRPEGGFMWAPDCAYKNGTYYFYFPHPSGAGSLWGTTWKIGVATSTKPARDFTCIGYINGIGGEFMIDPCVFVDDDGQAYFYYGGGGICQGGKLKANMIEIDGTLQNMTGLQDFHEGTWVFKRNGVYYLTYPDNLQPCNQMRYATSSNPLGPWTYRGVYLDPTDCETSHGAVVEFKGQWYQFYHNASLSHHGAIRSICVDRLYFNADGTIQKVTQTTSGPPAAGPTSAPRPILAKYEAENAALGNGATAGNDSAASGGMCVQNLHLANSYVQFNNVNGASGGRATIDLYFATSDVLAKLNLTVNGSDYSFLNTLSTGGWSTFSGHAYLTVPLNVGSANTIKLTGGNGGVNLDYITITSFNDPAGTPASTPTPIPTPTPSSGGTPINRSGWVGSGSGSGFSNAFDGNASTRWSTNTVQTSGQYFQVDMQSARTFNMIRMDTTGSPNDYPRGYQVSVSNDATNWTTVSSGAGSSAITDITFGSLTARYLKIVQTGSAPGNYWSIHEFNLYSSGGAVLFNTGLETGNTQPTWSDTIEVSSNVTGYLTGINPECGIRTGETSHAGTASLMFSGTDNNATTSFCYFKVFDVNIPITAATKLSYWFYPQMALAQGVALDFVCTDGTSLRDSGAKDQNSISMHPGNNRGTVNTWNQVQCNIGQWLNGKTIDRILVGYDNGPSTGQFRGYIDDIQINN